MEKRSSSPNSKVDQSSSTGTHINLRIQNGQDNRVLSYRIKQDIPLDRIMLDFCRRLGLQYDSIRFVYDGRRLKDFTTPLDLNMDDGAVIDAWTEQSGGGAALFR
ncbi:Small ubiquitin-related modifier 2 [Sesamum alatum]|uniref:Small ubiquitin-related modifier 2 n=1 Tax=Sesamum alatum TaxID=300844 RepID=A0AAE1YME3_9LAMI|nr:Small ubiquitin-related modifier 2 [Sesamum alatum]